MPKATKLSLPLGRHTPTVGERLKAFALKVRGGRPSDNVKDLRPDLGAHKKQMNCFCGAGIYEYKDRLEIRPHDIDCLWLAWVVTLNEDDVCAGCGHKFTVKRGSNWKRQACKRCGHHSFEMWA